MNHSVIAVKDEECNGKAPFALYDDKLRRTLSEAFEAVVVHLNPVLGCGVELLEWLEIWRGRFIKANKKFFIVPGNVNQLECLEVSHPNQGLTYAANAEEMEIVLARLPRSLPADPEHQAPDSDAQLPAEVSNEPAFVPMAVHNNVRVSRPAMSMDPGSTVVLSGEFTCRGCKTARMWLKGDVATKCTNLECLAPSAGWELTFELF